MKNTNKITGLHDIENRIFSIRGLQVMIDSDLAEMYQVETKRLNEQVRRNINRFPDTYRFQLTDNEKIELVANCDRFRNLKHSTHNPFAFTEQGAMVKKCFAFSLLEDKDLITNLMERI